MLPRVCLCCPLSPKPPNLHQHTNFLLCNNVNLHLFSRADWSSPLDGCRGWLLYWGIGGSSCCIVSTSLQLEWKPLDLVFSGFCSCLSLNNSPWWSPLIFQCSDFTVCTKPSSVLFQLWVVWSTQLVILICLLQLFCTSLRVRRISEFLWAWKEMVSLGAREQEWCKSLQDLHVKKGLQISYKSQQQQHAIVSSIIMESPQISKL